MHLISSISDANHAHVAACGVVISTSAVAALFTIKSLIKNI